MSRYFRSFFMLLVLWLLAVGFTCEKREVEVPVVGTAEAPIQIDTSEASFTESEILDLTDIVADILAEQNFDRVIAILLESVTYTVTDNESQANTVINGEIQVASGPSRPLRPLIQLSDVNLTAVNGVEQAPELNPQGVLEIDRAISPLAGGSNILNMSVMGSAAPSPPPNIRFKIVVKVTVTVIGIIETEVPLL